MELRAYQEDAVSTIMAALPTSQTILLQLPTGGGKTIIFSTLIKRLLSEWPYIRIGILAHRGILVEQAREKLLRVWPDAPIGIACASVNKNKNVRENIVIGTIQTLSRIKRIKGVPPLDIVIVDEAHHLQPLHVKSQYSTWLKTMRAYNPNIRLLGFTATPFRLGHGYIYGNRCKENVKNIFDRLYYSITIEQLQKHGYLCKYRAKELVTAECIHDLSGVKLSAGEYNLGDLSDVMSKELHIESAVKAYEDYAADRKKTVVFCVTIKHAEILEKAFRQAGYSAEAIHSKKSQEERSAILDQYENGDLNILTSVGVLSEGWDSPATDCILMCRPTKSPVLYCQMIGRGLRPFPGKNNVLILDLVNNCMVHKDPNNPKVKIPREKEEAGEAPYKTCPNCKELVAPRSMECPCCGYLWEEEEKLPFKKQFVMRDVPWGDNAKQIIELVSIENAAMSPYVSRAGNSMLKLRMACMKEGHVLPQIVHHYFDFDGNSGVMMQRRSRGLWSQLAQTEPPESLREAYERRTELLSGLPSQIEIEQKEGKFWNVRKWQV